MIALEEEYDEIREFPRLANILVVESEVVNEGNLSWMELNRRLTGSEMDEKMFGEFDGINLVNGSVEVNDVLDLAESRKGRGGFKDYEKIKKLLDELAGIDIDERSNSTFVFGDNFKTLESLLEKPLETFFDTLRNIYSIVGQFLFCLKSAMSIQYGYEKRFLIIFHSIMDVDRYIREIGKDYGFDRFLFNWNRVVGHLDRYYLNLRKLEPTVGIVKTPGFTDFEVRIKQLEDLRDDDTHQKLQVLVEKVRSLIEKWSVVKITDSLDISLSSVRDILKPIPNQFKKFEDYFQVLSKHLKDWRYKLKVRKWEATSTSKDLNLASDYLKIVANFKNSIGNGSISGNFENVKQCLQNIEDSFQQTIVSKVVQDGFMDLSSITKELISMFEIMKQIGNFTEFAKSYVVLDISDVQKLNVTEILMSSNIKEVEKLMIVIKNLTKPDEKHEHGRFHNKIEEWNSLREELSGKLNFMKLTNLDCLSKDSLDYDGMKKVIEKAEKENEEVWNYDFEELENVVDVMLASKKTSRKMKKKTSEVDWIGSEDEKILRTFTMDRIGLRDLMAGVKALEMVIDVQKAQNSWKRSDYPKVQKSWEIIDSQMKTYFNNITDINSLIQSPSPHFETAELLDYIWNEYPGDSRIHILRVLKKVADFELNYSNITRDLGNMEKSVKWMKDWVKTVPKENDKTSTSACTDYCYSSTSSSSSSSKMTSELKDDTSTIQNVKSSTQVTSQS